MKKTIAFLLTALLLLNLTACKKNPTQQTPENVAYRDSYTGEDQTVLENADTVVARMGNKELTNGMLQVYYWMEFYDFLDRYYLSEDAYFTQNAPMKINLDLNKPLDEQYLEGTSTTWEQYFLEVAIQTWRRYQALCVSAEEAGFVMKEEYQTYLERLPEQLEETAQKGGYQNAAQMLKKEMGAGCRLEDYVEYMRIYYYGFQYFDAYYESLQPTDEEVREYFNRHDEDFEQLGVRMDGVRLIDVRHILLEPEGGTKAEDGTLTYSDEEWERCEEKAAQILNEWLAGAATSESFGALADKYSEDTGSNTSGGLYTNISEGYMMQAFNDWCFADGRKPGDYGIIRTKLGCHIMYFVGSNLKWQVYAKDSLKTELSNQFVAQNMEKYGVEVLYENIVLGSVDFSGKE